MNWYEETFRATVVLVAASVALIAPGAAGIDGSMLLGVVFVALAGPLFAVRGVLSEGPVILGHDIGSYVAVLWLSPLLAALISFMAPGATPGELQALGGLVGLAGMANYFLRPLYRLGYRIIDAVVGTAA
jgi:hypothetical protein